MEEGGEGGESGGARLSMVLAGELVRLAAGAATLGVGEERDAGGGGRLGRLLLLDTVLSLCQVASPGPAAAVPAGAGAGGGAGVGVGVVALDVDDADVEVDVDSDPDPERRAEEEEEEVDNLLVHAVLTLVSRDLFPGPPHCACTHVTPARPAATHRDTLERAHAHPTRHPAAARYSGCVSWSRSTKRDASPACSVARAAAARASACAR